MAEPEIGLQTRHWLELQRSGRQASPVQDRLAPAAADRVSKRMHDSFSHPIPEHFVDREFGDD
ncbi:DUF3613 domain-containing protein [Marinobacterium aestuariivivens]|uniref:DUF3613 domain-containing protein n=1 Tax=Marinobacterium aestuariivivens TaxID=1698799 RepID=A0ABW2A193_9GAMM